MWPWHETYSFISIISFNQSFTIFFHLFQHIFSDSSSLHISKSFCSKLSFKKISLLKNLCYWSFSFSSPFAKKNSTRTNRLNSFCVSLLLFPKERRTNRLNSFVSLFSLCQKEFDKDQPSEFFFVSLFSLFQKNKGLTAWILWCLPFPFSKNSKQHNMRILFILPFPLNKRFQRTNRLRYLLFPLHKVSKD